MAYPRHMDHGLWWAWTNPNVPPLLHPWSTTSPRRHQTCCSLDPAVIELCFKKSSCEYYLMLVGNLYYLYKLYKMYKIVFTTRLFLKHSSILPGSNRVTYHPSLKLIQCFKEERGGPIVSIICSQRCNKGR